MSHPVQHPSAVVDFLRKVVAAPGVLSGFDLVTGERYSSIVPHDTEEFLASHVLGPARVTEPPLLNVTTTCGEQYRRQTFVRATVLPCTADDRCTHVAVRFQTRDSMSPSEEIVAASLALHRAGIAHHLERSVLTGVWVLWLPFSSTVDRAHAESLTRRFREILKGIGILQEQYVIPLLQAKPTELHLPGPFFSGGFLGVMFDVDDEGYLQAIQAGHGGIVEQRVVASAGDHGLLDGLLERWFLMHGTKAFRAGEIAPFARQEGLLPAMLSDLPPQAAAIKLGRQLLELASTGSTKLRITASRSGNSNVFRIEERSRETLP